MIYAPARCPTQQPLAHDGSELAWFSAFAIELVGRASNPEYSAPTLDVLSHSPLPCATILWRAEGNAGALTVVVKATFDLAHGAEATLANIQEPIGGDRHHGGDASASLAMAGDYAPRKSGADVVLVGHAYAPRWAPVETLACRVTVGSMTKALRVTGHRRWTGSASSPTPGAPIAFSRLALRYELGERSDANPVGLDMSAAPVIGAPCAPNFEVLNPSGGLGGMGPIAPTWRSRSEHISVSPPWANELCPVDRNPTFLRVVSPPPPTFDASFFNVAPPDQRKRVIELGEEIVLENLDAQLPFFATRLPSQRPFVFYIHPTSRTPSPIALVCDTLVIDTDRRLATVTFRGSVEVELFGDEVVGRVMVTTDGSDALPQADVVSSRRTQDIADEVTQTDVMRSIPSRKRSSVARIEALENKTRPLPAVSRGEITLPFRDAAPLASDAAQSRQASRPKPFSHVSSPPAADAGNTVVMPVVEADGVDLPFKVVDGDVHPITPLDVVDEERSASAHIPPARISASIAAPLEPKPPPARTTEDLELHEIASLMAAIDHDGSHRSEILLAARVDPEIFEGACARATNALREEASRGSTESLARWDTAWVSAVEKLRGPILVTEYAAITIGAQRGQSEAVLSDLGLGRGALLPIERTFLRRAASDFDHYREITEAVAKARKSPR